MSVAPAELKPDAARSAAVIAQWMRGAPTSSAITGYAAPPKSVIEWGEQNFWIPSDSGRPKLIRLLEHQKFILELFFNPKYAEALGCSPNFQTLVYSTIKKSGKTAISAMVARWITETWGSHSEVFALANDLEQARGRCYQAALTSIELDPRYHRADKGIEGLWRIIERQATHLPSHSTLKAVSADYKGEAGSNPVATFWCFDSETEVLTVGGWKGWDSLSVEDHVATLSPRNEFEWQRPGGVFVQDYAGEMVTADAHAVKLCVTPNHRIYGDFGSHRSRMSGTYSFLPASDASGVGYTSVPASCDSYEYFNKQETFTIPGTQRRPPKHVSLKLWAEFLGWYIAEGCVHRTRGVPDAVYIGQCALVNRDKTERIVQLAYELGFKPKLWRGSMSVAIQDVRLAYYCERFGLSYDKFVPSYIKHAAPEVLRAFFEAYMLGDGNAHGSGRRVHTVSKRLVDDLLEVGVKLGYSVGWGEFDDWRSSHKQYRVHFSILRQHGLEQHHWGTAQYVGKVFCPSTPNGVVLVRRQGTVYWSGNSELWGYSSEASQRLWEELTPVPTRPRSIRYIDTYSGFDGESSILNDLEDRVKKEGRRLERDELTALGLEWPFSPSQTLPFFIHQPSRTLAYWDSGEVARRMPWQTPTYYLAQRAELRDQAYKRLHENERVSSTDEFIVAEWWDRLNQNGSEIPDRRTPLVVGADASVTGDCTAIVAVSRDPTHPDQVLQRLCRVWTPERGRPLDYTQTIEPTLREWCRDYNVVEIAYDQYQLHDLMTRLRNEAVAWCRPFSQMGDRMIADKALYDAIRDQRIHHTGDDTLREHILNAGAKVPPDDNTRLRIVKKAPKSKIDAAVALSMACFEALRLNLL